MLYSNARVSALRSRRGPWSLAAIAGLAASLTIPLAACDQRSETARAVESASREVRALNAGSSAPVQPDAAAATYDKIVKQLTPVAGSGSPGEMAAAQVIIAQSNLALAEVASGETARLEMDARNLMTVIGSDHSSWTLHSAVAAAAESYDPSAELARIEEAKKGKDTEIGEQGSRRSQIEQQVTALRTQAKEKLDAADAKEAEYSRLMQSTVRLSATDAAPIVETANVHKRESDALRLAGSKLEAQADEIAPLLSEIDAIIAQLTNQKTHLDASRQSLQTQRESSLAEAADARKKAIETAGGIRDACEQLASLYSGDIEASYTKTDGLLNKAASAAQKSATESPGAGKLALGQANLALADLHWQKALGQRAMAAMYKSLAETIPALPNASDFSAKAAESAQKEKEALEIAKPKLEAARSAFSSVQVKDAGKKEKLQKLGELIDAAVKVVDDQADDLAAARALIAKEANQPPPAAEPAPVAAAPDAAPATDPALLAFVDGFLTAAREGRYADLGPMVHAPSPESRDAINTLIGMGGLNARIDAACRAKFNQSFAEVVSTLPGMGEAVKQMQSGNTLDTETLKNLQPTDITLTVSGDRGNGTAASLPKPLEFIRENGTWFLFVPEIEHAGPQLVMMASMMGPFSKVMEEFAAAVEAGQYPDAQAAAQGFMQKMMALGGVAPPPGGG